MSEYAMVLLIAGAVPFALSFWPPLRFYKNMKALLLSLLSVVVVFGAWDVFATWRGHWHFEESGVWGINIINLPLEEWLFFIVIPFCCVFTWEAMKYIRGKLK